MLYLFFYFVLENIDDKEKRLLKKVKKILSEAGYIHNLVQVRRDRMVEEEKFAPSLTY